MNLGLFNELINTVKENDFVQNFIKELTNCLNDTDRKVNYDMSNQTLNNLREENCLYQVVDRSVNGIYLQNTKNNKIFEETNIPKELKDTLENDFILRYKNGEYIYEKELTDDYINSLVGIKEYKEIQEKFINESNIIEIDSNARYIVVFRDKDYSVLSYGSNENDTIEVPNALLPYFIDDATILKYKDGKFEKDM